MRKTMSDICKIYKITNLVNGKLYIGQTWQPLQRRFTQHCCGTPCIKLSNAITKYGRDNFSIEMICSAEHQIEADRLEDYWIKQYDTINNGYNIKEGGSHGKHTAETKKKLSEMKTNPSDEVRRNLSLSHIGHKDSDETKKKKSQSHMGFVFSQESCQKISDSKRVKPYH